MVCFYFFLDPLAFLACSASAAMAAAAAGVGSSLNRSYDFALNPLCALTFFLVSMRCLS